jgi:uncharacterized integral membrane protein
VAETDTSQPAAPGNRPAEKPPGGSGPGGLDWKAIAVVALGIYALLLIILNSKTVSVDFVFVSHKTRVIFLVLLSMALGALIMVLVPRLRRQQKKRRSTSASVSPAPDDTG